MRSLIMRHTTWSLQVIVYMMGTYDTVHYTYTKCSNLCSNFMILYVYIYIGIVKLTDLNPQRDEPGGIV